MILGCLGLLAVGCARGGENVRFATYNAALSRDAPGALLAAMRAGDDEQAKAVAAVIQAANPDVLVLQEFDHGRGYDEQGEALRLFQQNYLSVPQADGLKSVRYPHVYLPPSNTGIPTGVDLNNDGLVAPEPGAELGTPAYAADCHGYGTFPGQYAFVVLSKHPIDRDGIRTFGEFLWKDLPGNHIPPGYYSDEALAVLRLSSKNHVDVPIKVGGGEGETIHVLAAHPTPPVFDGPEDRNGRRNYDEIKLLRWLFEVSLQPSAGRDVDERDLLVAQRFNDEALQNGFVVAGDLNADPLDGDRFDPDPVAFTGRKKVDLAVMVSRPTFSITGARQRVSDGRGVADFYGAGVVLDAPNAAAQLVLHPQLWRERRDGSPGGVAAARRQGGANADHQGNPAADTADWADGPGGPGNLRVDYVLPSADLAVAGGGVLWPTPDEPLLGVDLATVEAASDHRLVWVDVVAE